MALLKENAIDEELAPTYVNEFQKLDFPLIDPSWCVRDFIKAHMDDESTLSTHPSTNFKEQTTAGKLNRSTTQHINELSKRNLQPPRS